MRQRADKLFSLLERAEDVLVLLTKRENIRYFSGFTGEGGVLLSAKSGYVITDSRYTEAAAVQAPGCQVLATSKDVKLSALVKRTAESLKIKTVLFEDDEFTVKGFKAFAEEAPGLELLPVNGAPEKVRMVKDEGEIGIMARAESLVDKAFAWALTFVRHGMMEKELAVELDYHLCKLGGEGPAFNSIVCSGPNTSKPHAEPGERRIQPGDLVTMDFGCKISGLCSDFTRTFSVGQPPDELRKIYRIVKEANEMAFAALKPGMLGREVDAVARGHIVASGYGDKFGHGLGHGVGLLIHEGPRLGVTSEDALAPGHVVTIEPGIYLPGLGGVRIEDMVVVTQNGARNLTSSSKELVVL